MNIDPDIVLDVALRHARADANCGELDRWSYVAKLYDETEKEEA